VGLQYSQQHPVPEYTHSLQFFGDEVECLWQNICGPGYMWSVVHASGWVTYHLQGIFVSKSEYFMHALIHH